MSFFNLNNKIWQWTILLFLAFIWGSSFILMKRGLEVYSDTNVAALRLSISFLILLPFAIKGLKKIEQKDWKYIIATGLFGNGIPAFLFTKAQTEISSSLSGMLNSLTPVFALIIGILFFKAKTNLSQILGVLIGLLGAVGLVFINDSDIANNNSVYAVYVIAATICYAISVNILKSKLKTINAIVITSLAFFTIGPISTGYLLFTDFIKITTTNPNSLTALSYISILSLFGTVAAVILFNMLIKRTTALFAASVTYLIPIIAILWGVLDGESFNLYHGISIIITLIGVYFINKFRE